ncbi:hypothetical protein FDE95_14535 [Clostridium botulinum]|uniref:Uncharacterized protein n=1 Tax=Clostridium botulinum TaxID=1491 RepID=A0A6G4EIU9_CLOBO|nr:hypothetical protein [Clostridium botulinum]NFH59899.1 hypothetical protein [Clostridium botulinum]NFH63085.1 hypothetical protein [Clostridium botulinum]NFJ88039.1 hypothetical protein [Clostridium botulinum]NFV29838.1 hypothetical protein [Clostridium botulinum]
MCKFPNSYYNLFSPFYPMTTRSNAPIALCESDSHQIKDLDSLLFFKMGVKGGYAPG